MDRKQLTGDGLTSISKRKKDFMRKVFNIEITGELYLKKFLDADLMPSNGDRLSASRYEEVVEGIINGFWNRFTTSQILTAIRLKEPRKVTVTAYDLAKLTPAEEALLKKGDASLTAPEKANALMLRAVRANANVQPENLESNATSLEGFGKGCNATLNFNPGVYGDFGGNTPLSPGVYADEMLVHELTHAMSVLEGTMAKNIPFRGPFTAEMAISFQDLEEFTAMIIANMYRSEMGRPRLRKSYTPAFWDGVLKDGGLDATGKEFYRFFQNDIEQICRLHPVLARKLKQGVNIPFNPFIYSQV